MSNYMHTMNKTLIEMNRSALTYGDGRAWGNKKEKTMKHQFPRGKAWHKIFKRERAVEWTRITDEITDTINELDKNNRV